MQIGDADAKYCALSLSGNSCWKIKLIIIYFTQNSTTYTRIALLNNSYFNQYLI